MTKETIRSYFKGRNFVTPIVLDYGEKSGCVYELSEGEIFNNKVFGVSVIKIGCNRKDNLSRSFSTLNDAYRYIDNNFVEVEV